MLTTWTDIFIYRLVYPMIAGILAGFSVLLNAQVPDQAVILQYHHVSTATPPVTSLSLDAFTTHMQYLADNGFTVLPLEDVVRSLREDSGLPDRTAVITFDDGYVSVYEDAFPLLKAHGWPFTIFVTTGLLESNPALYADWDQIREMAAAGATIANHTVTHPYLLERRAGESEQAWLAGVRREIEEAEQVITAETGQNHKLLAYPYGEYDPAIASLVRELGFIGIAQHSGPINGQSDFTALPRFPFSGIYASMNTFPTKVNSLAFDQVGIEPESPLTAETSPGAVVTLVAERGNLDQLACYNNSEAITVDRVSGGENRFRVSTAISNRGRRFRYNCTAPGPQGRYYWYSIPWINPAIAE